MAAAEERVEQEVRRLCRTSTDVIDLHRSVAESLRRAVPFDRWCGLVLDPATLVATAGFHAEGIPSHLVGRLAEIEATDDDYNQLTTLARTARGVSTLERATAGSPQRSRRYREVLEPGGLGPELRAVMRERDHSWAGLVLLRELGAPDFTDRQVAMVARVSGSLARGVRRCMLEAELRNRDATGVPGMAVVGAGGLEVQLCSAAARGWLAMIDEGDPADGLPMLVGTLVARARLRPDAVARSRVRTRGGTWLTLYAEALESRADSAVSVVVEQSKPAELAEIMADAYALSAREREVAQQVMLGRSTKEIGAALFLSPWTVQDHLKSAFEKVGVRSRPELVARLFLSHYEPRLRAGAPVGADGWFIDAPG